MGSEATFTYTLARVNPFRSSARRRLIGAVVVAALMIVVAQILGQNEAKPRDAVALIFAILGVYLVLLFFLQLRDVSKAEGAMENPATLDEATLWAAMLVCAANSTRWNGVRGGAADGTLEIDRESAKNGDWLLDLRLAERRAEATAR